MRIGHYSNAATLPGGTATYVMALLKAQQAHGHDEDQDAAKGNPFSNFIGAPRHAINQATRGEFKTGFSNYSSGQSR